MLSVRDALEAEKKWRTFCFFFFFSFLCHFFVIVLLRTFYLSKNFFFSFPLASKLCCATFAHDRWREKSFFFWRIKGKQAYLLDFLVFLCEFSVLTVLFAFALSFASAIIGHRYFDNNNSLDAVHCVYFDSMRYINIYAFKAIPLA